MKLLGLLLVAIVVCLAFGGMKELFPTTPAVPPARASYPAGQEYAATTRWLAKHPQHPRKGMTYGILVRSASPGWASQQLNGGAWHGTVLIPGGRIERLASDDGDNGMAGLASVGDLIVFPAGGPVDAPSDGGGGTPARVLVTGAAPAGGA